MLKIEGKVGKLIDALNLASMNGGSKIIMDYLHIEVQKGVLLVSQRDDSKVAYILARFRNFTVTGEGSIFFRTQTLLDYLKLASADDDFTIEKTEDNKFTITLPEDHDTIKEIQQEFDNFVLPKDAPFKIKDNKAIFQEREPDTHILVDSKELKKLTIRNTLKKVEYYPLFFSPAESYSDIAKYDPDKKGMRTKISATVQGESGEITLGASGESFISTISGEWNIHITKGFPATWFFQENDEHKVGVVLALRIEGDK